MNLTKLDQSLRHNLFYNLLDGAFFGLAIGFASFVTIIPLFVSRLTDSAILIGLVPAMHAVGWYLPQLFLANRVSRQPRYKPMMMRMTIHERLPFLGLAIVAWLMPGLDKNLTLVIIFFLLLWQGLGGGFAANPWQNMIGKIIPDRLHGTFFGAQSGVANVLMAGGAILTGIMLEKIAPPNDFALIFLLAGMIMMLSMAALALVKEDSQPLTEAGRHQNGTEFRRQLGSILKNDVPFRKFLAVRSLIQMGIMAIGFYTVYIVKVFDAPGSAIGVMTAIMSVTKVFGNIILGRVGDRIGHKFVLQVGSVALSLSIIVAWLSPNYQWFYLAFALAGLAYVAAWTTPMAMTLQFGTQSQRPAYIGLSNTITAPSALLAPVLGGWLADLAGYPATFLVAVFAGVFALGVLRSMPVGKMQRVETASVS